jgi:zinc transport system substrate-binding protein
VLFTFSNLSADIKVVASIKPIHSLVSYVMDGIGKPALIVDGSNSPHNFNMKPSNAKDIENADIIFWVGEDIESFLEKPLKSISKKAKIIEMMDIKGINKLKFRERNIFEDHKGHDHGHKKKDKHDDHGHKKKESHDHGHGHKKEVKHDDHGHGHGEFDPHIWLNPHNAEVMVEEIAKQLIAIDPQNSATYKKNSEKAVNDIEKLINATKKELKKNISFIVFHDAYQYFEKRFGLKTLGALTVNTDVLPGAEQLKDIRKVIKKENAKCIFSEPQFNPKIIKAIAKDTNIKTGVLDPLGANLKNNKDLYFKLLNNLSNSLRKC